MALLRVPADQVLRTLNQFDAVIDARSPGEYALDHLPGAHNWPTLNDDERQTVGTLYKQVGSFEAKKLGAGMAASNIGRHVATHVLDRPKNWKPLLYCWRGGKRSGSLALVLDQIGFQVNLLEGGYKAFRAALVDDIERLSLLFDFRVVCGTTGCGKTRLLHAIGRQGGQVLDLEALARHRSSVLGLMPGETQPTQKAFDTALWNALRQLDPARPVYVESESKKVGNVAVPLALMERIRVSTCLTIDLPLSHRIALLLEDYHHFVQDTGFFSQRLEALVQLRGRKQIDDWQIAISAGDLSTVVSQLLSLHYDPIYLASMERNFKGYTQGQHFELPDHGAKAFETLAAQILAL
jgi:tRNA 2-selenouridine synthase